MTVRTAYAGTALSGDVYTAANHARMPGGWIGYAEVTAPQLSVGTTEVDLTGLTVTVTVGASRRVRVTGHGLLGANGGAVIPVGRIKEGTTELGRWAHHSLAGSGIYDMAEGAVVLTPTAGAHTYKMTLQDAGTGPGTITLQSSVLGPSFILVEDLGPAT
jgi:hypothetical protein